jgi:hypothetical protein
VSELDIRRAALLARLVKVCGPSTELAVTNTLDGIAFATADADLADRLYDTTAPGRKAFFARADGSFLVRFHLLARR